MIIETQIKHDETQDWLWPTTAGEALWTQSRMDWIESHQEKWLNAAKARRVCLQAGGALGYYPRMLANSFEHVITCEPSFESFYFLVQNTQLPNITRLNVALGEKTQFVAVSNNSGDRGQNKIIEGVGNSLMITIDELNLPILDLLALDVEGHEEFVLKGAEETLSRCRPVVILEHVNDDKTKIFKRLNYKIGETSKMDTIFIPR